MSPFYDGKDVTNFIRTEEIGTKASELAHNQKIET